MSSTEFATTYGQKGKAPPSLWLVKDEGIYLMSNGKPAMPAGHNVVYADGYGKNADYDAVREAAGGDDFVEGLPIDEAIHPDNIPADAKWLVVELTEETITLVVR